MTEHKKRENLRPEFTQITPLLHHLSEGVVAAVDSEEEVAVGVEDIDNRPQAVNCTLEI